MFAVVTSVVTKFQKNPPKLERAILQSTPLLGAANTEIIKIQGSVSIRIIGWALFKFILWSYYLS